MSSTMRVMRSVCCATVWSDDRYSSIVAVVLRQRDLRGDAGDRERRAELVRGVGHEAALRLERAAGDRAGR